MGQKLSQGDALLLFLESFKNSAKCICTVQNVKMKKKMNCKMTKCCKFCGKMQIDIFELFSRFHATSFKLFQMFVENGPTEHSRAVEAVMQRRGITQKSLRRRGVSRPW
jgi:hypothetical protein